MEQISPKLTGQNSKLADLPKAIVSWLTFQKAAQMSDHIREDALSFPIVTLLAQTGWEIRREVPHPAGSGRSGAGRVEQIDFVGIKRLSADKTGSWAAAIETKIFDKSNSGTQWERVVNDILRLDALANYDISKTAQRFLIGVFPVGNNATSIARLTECQAPPSLLAERWLPGGKRYNFFEEVLPWSSQKNLKVSDLDKKFSKLFENIKSSGKLVPTYVNVSLVSMDWSDDFVCGLWRLSR